MIGLVGQLTARWPQVAVLDGGLDFWRKRCGYGGSRQVVPGWGEVRGVGFSTGLSIENKERLLIFLMLTLLKAI